MDKLTKENIQFIDKYLVKRGVKHLDVRVELIDHLASEYEEKSQLSLIEDYLTTKHTFIKDFTKKQQKSIHWNYQNQLWIQFFKFFYKPTFLLFFFFLMLLSDTGLQYLSVKTYGLICYFILLALIIYPLIYQIKYSKAVKKVQSLQSLFTVTSLPTLFLYLTNLIMDYLTDNPIFLVIYSLFSILLAFSAVIIIEKDKKSLLERYYQLIDKA
jgi:hypothetical protein